MTPDIPEEVRKVAHDAAVERWLTGSADTTQMLLSVDAALLAALPHLQQAGAATYTAAEVKVLTDLAMRLGRKEAGEEIAVAIEARRDERCWSPDRWGGLTTAARIARDIGKGDPA